MDILKNNGLTWIDIQNPKETDIQYLKNNYDFHNLITDELTRETLRPKVDKYKGHFYLVLHFPFFSERERKTYPKELDFIVTKNALITTHFTSFDVLDDFFKKLKNDEALKEQYLKNGIDYLLYHIITTLFNFSLRELDHIKINIDDVEEKIFNGQQNKMVQEISIIRRDIINFRRIILPQRSVLESLIEAGDEYFGKEASRYFTGLVGKYLMVWNNLENHKEAAEALQDTNESLLSTKINQVMKTLTIIATILLPITLISQIFGQTNSPFISNSSFWSGLIAMAVIAVVLLSIFKIKKWL